MDEREVGFLERELTRRLGADLERVPVRALETYLAGARRAERAARLFSAATTALVAVVVVVGALGAGRLLSTLREVGPVAESAAPTAIPTLEADLGGPAICSAGGTIGDRFTPASVAALSSYAHIAVVDVTSLGAARWSTPNGRWDPASTSPERTWIYRPIDGTITAVAKGDAAAIRRAPLRSIGGSVGCHTFSMMPSPSIEPGARYVVFLTPGADPALGFTVMEAWPVHDGLVATPAEGEVPLPALLSILEPSYPLDFRPATEPFVASDAAAVRQAVLRDPYYASVVKRLVVGPDPDPRLAGKKLPRLGAPVFVRSLTAGKPDEWLVPIEYGPESLEVLLAPVDDQRRARLGGSRGWSGSFPMVSEADARAKASTPNDPVVTSELVWAEVRATSMELEPFWRLVRRSGTVLYLFEGASAPVLASEFQLN